MIELVKIMVTNLIFWFMLGYMISWENHKYTTDYEKNYIYLGCYFFLVNTYSPPFMITYLKENYFGIDCVEGKCFDESSLYYTFFTLLILLFSLILWIFLKFKRASTFLLLSKNISTDPKKCKTIIEKLYKEEKV